jgi:hypothetical protein
MRIAATVLALLCLLSPLAGCARLAQPGVLPSPEARCANAGGSWSATGRFVPVPRPIVQDAEALASPEHQLAVTGWVEPRRA